MSQSSKRRWSTPKLVIAIVIVVGAVCAVITFLPGSVRLKDFTLCQANTSDKLLQPVGTAVLTPTMEITACGYLETDRPFIGNVYLRYYLNRGLATVFTPDSDLSLQRHSQYFSFPVRTSELLMPGKYRLYIFELGARNWLESIDFDINPSPDDQYLVAVEQALQIESKNPIGTVQLLENNLYKVRDKQVFPLLLKYLATIKHDKTIYTSGLGSVVTYLSQVTRLEAHVDHNFIGTMYNDEETWMKDIQRWRTWWDTNKEYLYWDDQVQMFKVKTQ